MMTERTGASPQVSVILPTYNRAQSIVTSVESVLSQTYEDFELIVVDDGSTDGTRETIDRFEDPRLRYVPLPTNEGANTARNVGIRVADADYIAFQDSDDRWRRRKLERQMAVMSEADRNVGVVYTGYTRLWAQSRERGPDPTTGAFEGDMHEELLTGNGRLVPTAATLVRRSCLGDVGLFDERLPRLQEWELWLRISEKYEFRFVDEILLERSMEEDGVSIGGNDVALIEALNIILDKYNSVFRNYPQYLAQHLMQLARAYMRRGETRKGRKYLLKSFKTNPQPRYAAAVIVSLFGSRVFTNVQQLYQPINSGIQ